MGLTGAGALALSGCGGSDGDSGSDGGDGVTLRLMVASYDRSVGAAIGDRWDDVVKAFEKKHPGIRVAIERVPFLRLDATLARRVKDGRAPDIAQSNVFAPYAETHALYPVEDLFDVPTQADFIPSFAEAGRSGYVQYGVPLLASTPRLFFHTGLFERAGLAGPPGSWAELRSAAQALKGIGVPTPYALAFGPEAAEDELLTWLLAGGGGYSDLGGYDFGSADNAAALDWLRDELVAPGLAGADPAKLTRTEAYAQFLKGRVGMLVAHPVLLGATGRTRLPFATAPFPQRDGDGSAPPLGITDWMLAFEQGGHARETGAFLTFLYAQESAASPDTGASQTLPVTLSGSQRLRADRGRRALWPFVDQMPRAEFHPVGLRSWPTVRTAVRERIGRAVAPGGVPLDVLEALDRVGRSSA
ncbi:extracellular solute-binding protein [Streptomyces sp. SID5785]|uniref:ABC transporter substrate-binding protein n=1 Tax=Streptomyces sp. SID5785 TaxID=2690309 RepID=UPI001360EF88|nr:extracellular solute-binding protein [Streptomyces sp. SID5785]MZD08075.1 extracellular solute-binding protein [Streptomyces sp. SID5785]